MGKEKAQLILAGQEVDAVKSKVSNARVVERSLALTNVVQVCGVQKSASVAAIVVVSVVVATLFAAAAANERCQPAQ